MHEVLVNHLGGLSLPRKSVIRLTGRPDMTLDVYHGSKTTMQQLGVLEKVYRIYPAIRPSPKIIKLCWCSTQLSMKFFLLISVKMPTIVGILTFMSRKNSIIGLSEL